MAKPCPKCPIRDVCIYAVLNRNCPIKTNINNKEKKKNG
nr:MAG TPA: endonuclease [Caudoviricetes sp.]